MSPVVNTVAISGGGVLTNQTHPLRAPRHETYRRRASRVPPRYRFGAAVLVARAATPLLRLTSAYREQELKGFDGPHEIALHFVLNALTRNGARFHPSVEVKGLEELERACAAGTGVLVLGPHAALTLLMIRLFHDRGLDPVVITPDPGMR